jgi:mono/diheme cytochrome c family protein
MAHEGRIIVTAVARSLVLAGILGAQSAVAADLQNGKRIAEARCAECHFIVGHLRKEVAAPFATISSKYGSNAELIAHAFLEQHPRMVGPGEQEDVNDVAAYIATIGR